MINSHRIKQMPLEGLDLFFPDGIDCRLQIPAMFALISISASTENPSLKSAVSQFDRKAKAIESTGSNYKKLSS